MPPEAWQAFESRLMALAGAHDVLTSEDWQAAPLHQLIERTGLGCGAGPGRVRMEGPDLRLAPQTAVALSMALHELCTNAVKYGALSNEDGTVSVTWTVEGSRLRLDWKEEDGPPVAAPARRGFGTRMIERGLASELGGSATIDFAADGVRCRIDAPLPAADG